MPPVKVIYEVTLGRFVRCIQAGSLLSYPDSLCIGPPRCVPSASSYGSKRLRLYRAGTGQGRAQRPRVFAALDKKGPRDVHRAFYLNIFKRKIDADDTDLANEWAAFETLLMKGRGFLPLCYGSTELRGLRLESKRVHHLQQIENGSMNNDMQRRWLTAGGGCQEHLWASPNAGR